MEELKKADGKNKDDMVSFIDRQDGKDGGTPIQIELSDRRNEDYKERIRIYYQMLKNYLQIRDSDKNALAELVMRAKGPDRSMRKFAEELGVNPSTISRLISGKTVGNTSVELLVKIAAMADKDSGVTFDQLLYAQGMVEAESPSALLKKYEGECRRIFVDALLQRGYMVKDLQIDYKCGDSDRFQFDFAVTTDALGTKTGQWAVQCGILSAYSNFPAGMGRTRMVIERAMAYFYLGGTEISRISFLVDNKLMFEQIKMRLEEVRIPNELSVILINTKNKKITAEYAAPCVSGKQAKIIFEKEQK